MEKLYRNTAFFIVLIILGVQWGFYKVYTSQFPNFIDKSNVIHIHGMFMMAWLVMLVVQPLLIATGRAQWHRSLGKLSYVLGPLVIISLFLIGKEGYWHGVRLNAPTKDILATMTLDVRGFICFALFWSLAMINRKNSHAHMRYMIATGILAIGPGFGRGLINELGFDFQTSLTITDLIELAIPAVCLAADIYRKKDIKPWLTVFVVMAISAVLWQVKYSEGWQSFAATYASLFYGK